MASAAKVQDLSLNPQKLAGQCGKLKCCLNYETANYYDKSSLADLYPLSAEDVREIIRLNRAGEKPASLKADIEPAAAPSFPPNGTKPAGPTKTTTPSSSRFTNKRRGG